MRSGSSAFAPFGDQNMPDCLKRWPISARTSVPNFSVRRRDVARRSDVAVGLVVLRLRGDEYGARLDFPRLGPTVPALGSLQALLPHWYSRAVGHDADERRRSPGILLRAAFVLREVADGIAVQPDDFPHGVGGDAERVLRGEVPRGADDGVDLRGASQDELRDVFFSGDSDDAISFASASESSKTRSLSFLPAATAALNSETLSTGMENEWFFPPRVYWRLW